LNRKKEELKKTGKLKRQNYKAVAVHREILLPSPMADRQNTRTTVLYPGCEVDTQLQFTHTGIILYVEYQSECLNVGIESPHPLPQQASASTPLDPRGEGVGRPNSDEGIESLAFCIIL
jgi:hypothetical protein